MLEESYERCCRIHREHGRSYYLATRLLPAAKRRHVHALYAFTRWADDIVDDRAGHERAERLEEWGQTFLAGLAGAATDDPLLPAVVHTVETYRLDLGDFDAFLRSMAMDLKVTAYPTYDDLLGYMEGSAAAIGTMMLPILGVRPGGDPAVARESARQLGFAFQLTNFIRDVREDAERGRLYLPEADLDRFGLTPTTVYGDAARGTTSSALRSLLRFEAARARQHYAAALPGLALLEPRSRVCIRAAFLLYGGILGEIERADFDVMARRAVVPRPARARMVLDALSSTRFAARSAGYL